MAHGYRKAREDSNGIIYEKNHENGDTTTVQVDPVGTEATGGQSYVVVVRDPNGNQRLGRFETKEAARKRATQWMNNHPKGVQRGVMGSMEQGTKLIYTGGGLFE